MYLLGHISLKYVPLYKQLSRARPEGEEGYIVREAKTMVEERVCLVLKDTDYET